MHSQIFIDFYVSQSYGESLKSFIDFNVEHKLNTDAMSQIRFIILFPTLICLTLDLSVEAQI